MALIYVVEDDISIQEIESFALANAGYQVKGFSSAKEFYIALSKVLPDLILLDVMLPDEDGLSIVKTLRASRETGSLPVIMVTAKTAELDKVKGLDIGADDYMTKPFGIMELISRVKAMLRRSVKPEEENRHLKLGAVELYGDKRSAYVNDIPLELTYKEYELLKLLMSNAEIVTTRESILNQIWGTDFEGESRTLDMHIKTLRHKLGTAGSMIKTIRNVGYIISSQI